MKHITTLLFLSISTTFFAQKNTPTTEKPETSVSKSLFGVQVGLLGAWFYNELKLTDKIALRSELGLQTFFYTDLGTDKTYYFLNPEIVLEPRFYYNLNKRNAKGKNISDNSGNYVSLRNAYYPDAFKIGNTGKIDFVPELHIVPTWGMKRNLGKNFNYEIAAGLGYRKVFEKDNLINNNNEDVAYNIQARIGYKF